MSERILGGKGVNGEYPGILVAALSYVRSRLLETGGFCYFKAWGSGAPSILDTHAAILSCAILNVPVFLRPEDKTTTLDWIGQRFVVEVAGDDVIALWHLSAALSLLGEPFPGSGQEMLFPFLSRTAHHFLQDSQRKRLFVDPDRLFESRLAWNRLADLSGWKGPRIGPYLFPDRSEMTLLDHCFEWEFRFSRWNGADRDPPGVTPSVSLLEWEHPLSGYVLQKGSTATDIGVISTGVLVQKRLNQPLLFPTAVINWVINSQSLSGGFGRIPGAVPDLCSTAQGILILELLTGAQNLFSRELFEKGFWWFIGAH